MIGENNTCELCGGANGLYHVGGACRCLCARCEKIVIKWEEKKKIYNEMYLRR